MVDKDNVVILLEPVTSLTNPSRDFGPTVAANLR